MTEVITAETRFPGRLPHKHLLRGQYRVDTLIGVGGMGAVYRAEHHLTRQMVAIKVLWRDLASNPAEVKRFTREARAASVLTHPNTVRVYDFGRDRDTNAIYMVMELLEGVKLSDVLRKTPVLSPARVVHIGTQCCKALEEAHSKGLVHRDLKPDNIFLQEVAGESDYVKVLDFGLAKFVKGDFERDTLTKSGYVVGSPEYMAPEQAIGSAIGPAVDIYSLGIVLYECLTGDLPFDAETTAQVLRKHIMEDVPRMFDSPNSGVPEALEKLVMQCLQKDPKARPASAESLRIQLLKAYDRRRQRRRVDTMDEDVPMVGAEDTEPIPKRAIQFANDDAPTAPLVMAPGAVATRVDAAPDDEEEAFDNDTIDDDDEDSEADRTDPELRARLRVSTERDLDPPDMHDDDDEDRPVSGWMLIAICAAMALGMAVVALFMKG